MGIFIVAGGILVVCIAVTVVMYKVGNDWAFIPAIFSTLSFVWLLIMAIVLLCLPVHTTKQIASYEAMVITVQDARSYADLSALERAFLTSTIAQEYNQVILTARRLHNHKLVGCFYRKEVADLDLILWSAK